MFFIIVQEDDSVIKAMDAASVTLIKCAQTELVAIEQRLNNGDITQLELNKCLREKDKTHRLLKASNAATNVDLRYYEKVLAMLNKQFEAIKTLFQNLKASCLEG